MFKRLSFLSIVFLVNSMCCTAVNGAESPVEEQPQIFTNQDIESIKDLQRPKQRTPKQFQGTTRKGPGMRKTKAPEKTMKRILVQEGFGP